jgi:hypothetical protein
MAGAHVTQIDLQAVVEEGKEIAVLDDGKQPQPHLAFHDDAHDAERCAAKRVGVLGTGRLFVDGPETGQRIELVGERHRQAHGAFRQAVGRALRLVVILDGGGNFCRFALKSCIFAAHQALQFGKLAHRFGAKIGFGEHDSTIDQGRIGTDERGKLGGK